MRDLYFFMMESHLKVMERIIDFIEDLINNQKIEEQYIKQWEEVQDEIRNEWDQYVQVGLILKLRSDNEIWSLVNDMESKIQAVLKTMNNLLNNTNLG